MMREGHHTRRHNQYLLNLPIAMVVKYRRNLMRGTFKKTLKASFYHISNDRSTVRCEPPFLKAKEFCVQINKKTPAGVPDGSFFKLKGEALRTKRQAPKTTSSGSGCGISPPDQLCR
jgi:hypothetical protein